MIKKYVVYIRNLKQALNHRLVLKKVHRVIKFNQKAWLKSYIDMKTKLRKKGRNDFEIYFFKLKDNAVFAKTMENVRKKNYLVSQPNYHTTKCFSENLLAIETKKTKKNRYLRINQSI